MNAASGCGNNREQQIVSLEIYEEGIKRTGFELEYRVASTLRLAGWNVISNKYYVDDHQETVREIDLVAYKAAVVNSFHVYTTLIVSCKKSEKNVWAFLAKDRADDDPNADRYPAHIWTNCKAPAFVFGKSTWRREYHDKLRSKGLTWLAAPPEVDIFAFQEMNKASGAPQNDKPLFESVTSLMKAQAFELGSLPGRKKKAPAIYQFNLLTVADTDFVRLHFSENKIEPTSRPYEQYVASYIVNKQQTTARIHFSTIGALPDAVLEYDRLHAANVAIFNEEDTRFYADVFTDAEHMLVLVDDFRVEVQFELVWALRPETAQKRDSLDRSAGAAELVWVDAEKLVAIEVDITADEAAKLNDNEPLKKKTAKALAKIYRYTGAFKFAPSMPF
jgi:hypothetical protein